MSELAKTFDPAAIEAHWYAHWEEHGLFRPERPGAQPWTMVNPPPNVTGSLHIGHALDNTLQDVMARYERMRGRDVRWVVGTDHAGIATQMVVERNLASQGLDRRTMGREPFLAHVWEWKAQSGGTITRQLRRLGCSMDWANERFTMDEGFSAAVRRVFVELYRDGLIYRDKRLVNWDPKLGTAISDLEVETREVAGKFWHLSYPLADGSGAISVATTRPETMLADMAVAVNPDDDRYRALVGQQVRLPITGRLVPIVADEHADPELGSGAVKITPGHDFNDFEVGRRAGIAAADMLNMLDAAGRVVQCGGIPDDLIGLDRFDARRRVVELLEEAGALERVEDRTIQTPYGDRSGVVIEPWLTDQWYVDAKTLAGPAIAAVRSGAIEIVPKTWEKTFFNWMENIQPWCVSRQLWWGHRIPAWFADGGRIFVADSEAEAQREAGAGVVLRQDEDVLDTWFSSALWPFATLGWPDGEPKPPFASSEVEKPIRSAVAGRVSTSLDTNGEGSAGAARGAGVSTSLDTNGEGDAGTASGARVSTSLDTNGEGDHAQHGGGGAPQAGSPAASPPHRPADGPPPRAGGELQLDGRYPNDLLISGFDILFFWDARMMMQGIHFLQDVPFRRLYLHGLVRAADGQKMSKSKGNTVDPLGLIDRYGADALRFFMAAMESQGRDIKMDERRVEGYRNFATKLWNAARFCQANGIGASAALEPPTARHAVNQWIIAETVACVQALELALADLRFDAAANAIYQFAWSRFCDWYLELIKPASGDQKGAVHAETRAVAGWVLDQILVMLHPFMPFVTEELWHALGERPYDLIVARWPVADARALVPDAAAEIDWLIRLVSEIRSGRTELGVAPGARLPLHVRGAGDATRARLARHAAVLGRLARVDPAEGEPAGGALQVVVDEATFVLPLAGVIDIAAEKARLEKAIAGAAKERDALAGRLANASFVERAKPEAVEKARADHADKAAEAARLQAALARLG